MALCPMLKTRKHTSEKSEWQDVDFRERLQSKKWRGIDGTKAMDEVQLSRAFNIRFQKNRGNMKGIWICYSSIYSKAALGPE